MAINTHMHVCRQTDRLRIHMDTHREHTCYGLYIATCTVTLMPQRGEKFTVKGSSNYFYSQNLSITA